MLILDDKSKDIVRWNLKRYRKIGRILTDLGSKPLKQLEIYWAPFQMQDKLVLYKTKPLP